MDRKTKSHWSGQFFVAGELVRRGYWTSFTMGNVPSTDLVAISQKGTPFKIEVKATRKHGSSYLPKLVKASADLFYIFVVSRPKDDFPPPMFWVMTSFEVQKILRRQEREGISPQIKKSDLPKDPGGWEKLPDYSTSIEK